jgi:diguanylate cyclase (GGDEF)-like protein
MQSIEQIPESMMVGFIYQWGQFFHHSYLAQYIDMNSLGWILFILVSLIYILSKEQWLRARKDLQKLVMLDPLTNLPNRRLFESRAVQLLKSSQRYDSEFALMISDLDNFKVINDTLGHQAGDLFLKEVAKRFHNAIRSEDTVARIGGDEFAFLITGVKNKGDIRFVVRRLYESLAEPIMIDNKSFDVGLSIGIALFPEHSLDIDGLLKRADIALYRAKETKNACKIYACGDRQKLGIDNLADHHDLRKAL